jgi:hypothetical protein
LNIQVNGSGGSRRAAEQVAARLALEAAMMAQALPSQPAKLKKTKKALDVPT